MKRSTQGEVKLMHDMLVQTMALYAEDNETIVQAADMLLSLADEIAALQANLDRHMEVIVNGRKANEALCAKYSTLFNAVKNLRDQQEIPQHLIAYERLMTLIGEEK